MQIILITLSLSIETGLKSDNMLPQLSQLLMLWNKNQEVMTLFCNQFLACVTGKNDWKVTDEKT